MKNNLNNIIFLNISRMFRILLFAFLATGFSSCYKEVIYYKGEVFDLYKDLEAKDATNAGASAKKS